MTPLQIIDPHIHYWDPYTTPRTLTPAVKLLGRFPRLLDWMVARAFPAASLAYFGSSRLFSDPFLPPTYFAEANALPSHLVIKGVVHVQADWQAKTALELADETAWLANLDRPPLAIVGEARLDDLEHLTPLLDAHAAASDRFRGVRDMLAFHDSPAIHKFNSQPDMIRTAAWRTGFAMLGERGLSFDAFIFSHQLDDLCDLVETYPDTPIVLDHVGSPIAMMGPFGGLGQTAAARQAIREKWQAGLQRLARSTHVHVKISGLFMHVLGWEHRGWDNPLTAAEVAELIGPTVELVLATFGPDRCMFASNFPPDRVLMQLGTLYEAYFKICHHLGFDDATNHKLFYANAERFYRLNS